MSSFTDAARKWGTRLCDSRGVAPVARACSACAGDYEDPERSAPRAANQEESESEATEPRNDEFLPGRASGQEGGEGDAEEES